MKHSLLWWLIFSLQFHLPASVRAAEAALDPAREREMRQRYEIVLLRNPFQERAFDQVYESYSKVEGVDKWVDALKPKAEGNEGLAALLLLGQIYGRQFKTAEAVAALEQAAAKGENRPQFKVLLGTLYYKAGQDKKAAELLTAALDVLTDLDQRSAVCRMLGNVYLRQGERERAIRVWQRISEQNPNEIFSQLELAEIYEDNRMWNDAIQVYRRIADLSAEDAYRRCRALRSIGQCLVQAEQFKEAIAAYEQALELVAPGNWLFEDLKLRLVGVYEDIGDLAGLVRYLGAKLEQNPGDMEFRDLLAETYGRMARFDEAEKEYRTVLERNPRSSTVHEKLISLFTRTGKKEQVVAEFEKLIELFPNDSDYLRRLGEVYLRDNNPEKAKETWRRVAKESAGAERLATLAGWFESYEFLDDAVAAYQQAVQKGKNKDWVLRLAALKFQQGEEAEALRLWLGALDPATSKVEDYAEIASILEANQKLSEALSLRKAAVDKDATHLESRLAYAKLLMRQQKFEAAVAEFEVLASQEQNEFLALQGETGRLDAWRELGVLEEKQKEWERDLQQNPSDGKKLGQLARLYERSGQRDKAVALYEGRREQEPHNLEHLRALAGLYKNGKQMEQAIATFSTLLEQDKNRARVYQKELLDIYLGVDLKAEAIAAAEQMVSLAPADPEARLTLAQVYSMYRQPEKALNEYRFALRLEPNEPDYHRQYGEALELEKRYGEAQEAFRKMLDAAKEDSTRLSAVANLARIHLQQDRLSELAAEFQRRIRNTPKKLAAYEELATIYKESGQVFRGVEVLESGLQNVDDKGAALKSLIRLAHEAQDYPKVKSYYEQLVALSGKPSANEFERLGQIYAQLGDIEKAKAAWNNILSAAPKDPKAHDRVAKLLQEQGFTDEGLAVRAKAIELDPADYKRRFEYAQQLSQTQQPIQAMDQLRLLLEIGDRAEKKEEKESEKKVKRVSKGQPNAVSPYQFMYTSRSYGRYWGGGWQGSFKDFRPSVIQFMASLAQQSIGEDAFVQQMQERAQQAGATTETRRDLLTILQLFNRMEEGLQLAAEMLAAAPTDPDLLQTMALFYSDQQKLDEAISLLERLARAQPKQRMTAATGLVPLYFKNKQPEKALAVVEEILKENPTDVQPYYVMSNLLQNNAKYDEAKRVLNKLREVDPQQAEQVRNSLATIAKQSGKVDEAFGLYREALFSEAQRPAYYARSKRIEIYLPELQPSPGRYYGNAMQSLPPTAFGPFPWDKVNALTELKNAAKTGKQEGTNVLEEMERLARAWSPAATPNQRERSWDMTRLLVAHFALEKEFEKAESLLAHLRQAGFDEAAWFNLSIYVAQQKEDYATMKKGYDELQQRFPAKARDTAIGRADTYLLAKKFEEAAKTIGELNEQRVPPAQILGLIGHLQRLGEKKLAQRLLEEHLSGVSRNPQALSMLASIYGEDGDFAKATTLANEAWERKAHGTPGANQSYAMYGMSYGYMPRFGQVDNLLNELHRYYVGAGKSDELLERFKQVLEKQPGSVQAHENLASLYRFSDQRDKALLVYQQLAERRPHLLTAKRAIAGIYQEMGQFDQATKLYEDLIKANPNLYQSFQWELRSAYQRQGKGKELQKMEDNLAAKARDPNQLMQLAMRMKEDGEVDKAIELLRKAVKMSPGQSYFYSQLASALVEKGQLDEALKAYEDWISSPQLRSQGFMDHYTMRQFAGLYKGTGKLEDLKKRCADDLAKNSADRMARAIQAHIAFLEKRFDDALAGFRAILDTGADPNLISQLIEIAGFSGKFQEVLALAEKADSGGSSWNAQQLASLYLALGDKQKAAQQQIKWAEDMIQQGNGSWALRETMEALGRMTMWEEAEQFATKHRTDNMEQWEADEFDRTIASGYVNDHRFEPVVKALLAKESLKGRDLSLVQKISEQLGSRPAERRQFLEKLVKADPKNRELTFTLVQLYSAPGELSKKLDLLQPLLEAEPAKADYRRAWAETLIELGRADEALTSLQTWAAEKPGEQRWTLLSQLQARAGRLRDARASLVKAAEAADPIRKPDLQLQLARFDSEQGDILGEKEALQARFLAKKDAQTFQSYWRFLEQNGWETEAHSLFVTNRDNGYFQQYQQSDFVPLCLNQSDYNSPADLNWRFTRYGERWERDWYFDRVAKVYRDRGKLSWFVSDFAKRIEQDGATNQNLWQRVARSWEQAGYPERALAIYDRQLETNPFNRTVVESKANLLVKLGRTEEAIAQLRDPKGITTLDTESNASISLIAVLLKLDRKAEADKEIEQLLAWDKRPNTLMRVGNLLMDQRQPADALSILERATGSLRDWNYEEILISLAKCRAKLGKVDDLAKLTQELLVSNNSEWRLQNLQGWLSSEGFHDLATRVIRSRLAKSPARLELHTALAASLQEAGQTNEALAAYESAAKVLPTELHGALCATCASFLQNHSLVPHALQRLESNSSSVLGDAVILVLASTDPKSARGRELAGLGTKLSTDKPELQLRLAQALVQMDRQVEAAEWYRRALSSTNLLERVTAAAGLVRTTGDKAAAKTLSEALATHPHWFTGRELPVRSSAPMPGVYYDPGYSRSVPYVAQPAAMIERGNLPLVLGKANDPALIEAFKNAVRPALLRETDMELLAALVSYYTGNTNEARPKLAALATAPHLKGNDLQTLARLFEEQGMRPERVQILQRIIQGGYGAQPRWQAMGQLVKIHAQELDFPKAVAVLARMQGAWGMGYCEEARLALTDAVTLQNYDAFRTAILDSIRNHPSDDLTSDLLGLCSQVAQRLGKDDPASKLAREAKAAEFEGEEAAAWDSLIEQWEIAGPLQAQASETNVMPDYNFNAGAGATSKLSEPALPSNLAWVKTDPRRELGVIRLGPVLQLTSSETAGRSAWARTTMTSPEDRRVTFCLGSDDWVRVWVNGEFVHSSSEPRSCALDQDRFSVSLKRGENRILLKIGNVSDAWNFCLRIAEGGAGMVLAAK